MYLIRRDGEYRVREKVPESATPEDILVIPGEHEELFIESPVNHTGELVRMPGGPGIYDSGEGLDPMEYGRRVLNYDIGEFFRVFPPTVRAMQDIFREQNYFEYGSPSFLRCRRTGQYYIRGFTYAPTILILNPQASGETVRDVMDHIYPILSSVKQRVEQTREHDLKIPYLFYDERLRSTVRQVGPRSIPPGCTELKRMGEEESLAAVVEATGNRRARVFPEGRGYVTCGPTAKEGPQSYLYARPQFAASIKFGGGSAVEGSAVEGEAVPFLLRGAIYTDWQADDLWNRTKNRIKRGMLKPDKDRKKAASSNRVTYQNLAYSVCSWLKYGHQVEVMMFTGVYGKYVPEMKVLRMVQVKEQVPSEQDAAPNDKDRIEWELLEVVESLRLCTKTLRKLIKVYEAESLFLLFQKLRLAWVDREGGRGAQWELPFLVSSGKKKDLHATLKGLYTLPPSLDKPQYHKLLGRIKAEYAKHVKAAADVLDKLLPEPITTPKQKEMAAEVVRDGLDIMGRLLHKEKIQQLRKDTGHNIAPNWSLFGVDILEQLTEERQQQIRVAVKWWCRRELAASKKGK